MPKRRRLHKASGAAVQTDSVHEHRQAACQDSDIEDEEGADASETLEG